MKKKTVTLENLYELANEYDNFSCKPQLGKYRVGTVIDEEKSVRWNREEVERRNAAREEEVKALNRQRNLLHTNLVFSIKEYIAKETEVSPDRATKIYNYLYQKYHSYGLVEVINLLDEFLELFV